MTRDELEMVIWRNCRALAGTGDAAWQAMDAILTAADAYAVTQGGITAERRAATDVPLTVRERRASLQAVHWLTAEGVPCGQGGTAGSSDPGAVTCLRCKASAAYRATLVAS